MCEALKELMKDELDNVEALGEARGELKGKRNTLAELVRKGMLSVEDAVEMADGCYVKMKALYRSCGNTYHEGDNCHVT